MAVGFKGIKSANVIGWCPVAIASKVIVRCTTYQPNLPTIAMSEGFGKEQVIAKV